MYRIAPKTDDHNHPFPHEIGQPTALGNEPFKYYISDNWSADIATGLLTLGEYSRHYHGLPHHDCIGILTLVSCYFDNEQKKIASALEEASGMSASFCFAAQISLNDGIERSIICFGESKISSNPHNSYLGGIFLIPKFELVKQIH